MPIIKEGKLSPIIEQSKHLKMNVIYSASFFAIYKTIKCSFYTLPLMPSFLFGCAGNLHKNTSSTQITSSAMKEPSWHEFLTVQKHFGFQIFV